MNESKYFESLLWQEICEFDTERPIFTEAESRKVGNLHIPTPLWSALTSSKVTILRTSIEARIDYLLEDYPHWPNAPADLEQRLDVLRSHHGHQKIDTWIELIQNGKWRELVNALLTEHYDPMYSGSKKYPAPSAELELSSVSEDELIRAASKLLLQS